MRATANKTGKQETDLNQVETQMRLGMYKIYNYRTRHQSETQTSLLRVDEVTF